MLEGATGPSWSTCRPKISQRALYHPARDFESWVENWKVQVNFEGYFTPLQAISHALVHGLVDQHIRALGELGQRLVPGRVAAQDDAAVLVLDAEGPGL